MMVLQKKENTSESPAQKIKEQSKIGAETSHFHNDKVQTSSSVSNGTIATTGPMDKN